MNSPAQVSIFEWLSHLFVSIEFQELWVYLIAGSIGIFGHYLKKLLSKEVEGNFYQYLVGDHLANTITALSTFVVSAFTYVFTGAVNSASWPVLIGLALTTGYAIDSTINKSTPLENK